MNASKPTRTAYFKYIGSIELPTEIIEMCPRFGSADEALKQMRLLPEVIAELSELDPENVRKELLLRGPWDDVQELQDDDENLTRILWVAVSHIQIDYIF